MSRTQVEQGNVFKYLKGIHPSTKANYDAMLRLVSQATKASEDNTVSESMKRAMYLQLIAHSVQESCESLIAELEDAELIVEISIFHRQVTSFCCSMLTNEALEYFDVIQEHQSALFTQTWESIVSEIENRKSMIH